MTPFPYRVIVRWSEPDGAYVAEVPAIRGAAGDGETLDAAVRAAQESATELLEVKRECGDAIPAPDVEESEFSGQTRIRMSKSLHRELAATADREGVSLNQLMVTFLAKQLGVEQRFSSPASAPAATAAVCPDRWDAPGQSQRLAELARAAMDQLVATASRSRMFVTSFESQEPAVLFGREVAEQLRAWRPPYLKVFAGHDHYIDLVKLSSSSESLWTVDYDEIMATASSGAALTEIQDTPSAPETSQDRTKVQ